MKFSFVRPLLVVLLLVPMKSSAHHGKEFLVSSTFKTPERGSFFALLSTDYLRSIHHGPGIEFAPGVLYGIADRWSAEFHTHHNISEGELHTESVGLETRFRFFGAGDLHGHEDRRSENISPFSLAAILEYEKNLEQEGDVFESRLIAGKDFYHFSVVVNLIARRRLEQGEGFEFRYAAGVKATITQTISAGVEFDNGESRDGAVLFTPGVYASLSETLDVRLGASFGAGKASTGSTNVRSVLIYSL